MRPKSCNFLWELPCYWNLLYKTRKQVPRLWKCCLILELLFYLLLKLKTCYCGGTDSICVLLLSLGLIRCVDFRSWSRFPDIVCPRGA